jgi:ankyrin repeat protein
MGDRQCDFGAACRVGDVATVDRLLLLVADSVIDPTARFVANDNGCYTLTPLEWACRGGHLAVVERLLEDERVDPSACDNLAMLFASGQGHLAVVERLLLDARVDPAASNNDSIHSAAYQCYSDVVERLLQDKRVDPAALHQRPGREQYPVSILTDAMLPRLSLTLSLPFPDDSPIILWQPRLRQYRQQQIDFLEELIANWQWHRGGLCRDVMDHIVSEYLLGMKLREFVALDAEYVAPPPLLTDPSIPAAKAKSSCVVG